MIKRISRYFILLLSLILAMVISGCKLFETPIVTYDDQFTLQMVEEYKPYFPYALPTFTLSFDGSVNTTEKSVTYTCSSHSMVSTEEYLKVMRN